jgi:hypothetical protein
MAFDYFSLIPFIPAVTFGVTTAVLSWIRHGGPLKVRKSLGLVVERRLTLPSGLGHTALTIRGGAGYIAHNVYKYWATEKLEIGQRYTLWYTDTLKRRHCVVYAPKGAVVEVREMDVSAAGIKQKAYTLYFDPKYTDLEKLRS